MYATQFSRPGMAGYAQAWPQQRQWAPAQPVAPQLRRALSARRPPRIGQEVNANARANAKLAAVMPGAVTILVGISAALIGSMGKGEDIVKYGGIVAAGIGTASFIEGLFA